MHLGALETQENTGGLSWHVQPSIMGCYFDFSSIFCLFFDLFQNSSAFHMFRCTQKL